MNKVLALLVLAIATVSPALASPKATPITRTGPAARYVALGDSMTYGYGTTNPGVYGYPYQLARADGFQVFDLGIPGEQITNMLTQEMPKVPRNANLITVMIGVNDQSYIGYGLETQQTFDTDLHLTVALLHKEAPLARILMVTPIDITRIPRTSPNYPVLHFEGVLEAGLAIHQEYGTLPAQICDVGGDQSYYDNLADFSPIDQFHPSNLGAQHIAMDIDKCLQGKPL